MRTVGRSFFAVGGDLRVDLIGAVVLVGAEGEESSKMLKSRSTPTWPAASINFLDGVRLRCGLGTGAGLVGAWTVKIFSVG